MFPQITNKTNFLKSQQKQFKNFSKTNQLCYSKIIEITPENFDKEILESNKPVLVDCFAGKKKF